MLLVRVLVVVTLVILGSTSAIGHEESGEWSCEMDPEMLMTAEYMPGVVTIDGQADDWNEVYGSDFFLLPALDPDADRQYKGGKMTVKALHDGKDLSFLLKVDGDYVYSKGESKKCASVALMFQVGESATYHDMGGCKESPETCNSKTCRKHEVDIMHFSIGTAIPGQLYGGNLLENRDGDESDRFGHLVDLYAWNPHCRHLDANGSSAQNNWKGAWWHSSFTKHTGFIEEDSPYASLGQKGAYYFEFSRPLRTMDHLQQDVQFTIGQRSKFSVAFWYPVDGNPWHGSGHYAISCDWVPLDILQGTSSSRTKMTSSNSWDAASAFALIFSIASLIISVYVGYWLKKSNFVPFTPMDRL